MTATPQNSQLPSDIKSGFVALVGRPNVGKSTLLNRLIGSKVAITSFRPQTTRNRIVGLLTKPGFQIVFMDTPGIMKEKSRLNKFMVGQSVKAGAESDMTLFMTDAEKPDFEADKFALSTLGAKRGPRYLLINKIDAVKKMELLSQIATLSKMAEFDEIFPVSARTGEGVDEALAKLVERLPTGPQFYPSDIVTDQPERFFFGELIREKAFMLLRQELPYATAVMIDDVEDKENGVTVIMASIIMERDSQKGIVIGKGGAMLKQIGSLAREELEVRLDTKVFLDIRVKVKEKWTSDTGALSELGYKDE
ncbi:MAG: GTPase Era [Nitrospinae bacterium]|nr:GTPase Era [Nitrospinota bacterium]